LDDPAREETASMPPSEPEPNLDESTALAVCFRTGLAFQTSPAMKLLPIYDDGITPSVAMIPFNTEPVFCRICREGLHEDADDEQPAAENEDNTGTARDPASRQTSMEENLDFDDDVLDDDDDAQEPVGIEPTTDMNNINNNNNRALMMVNRGPVSPHPAYAPNPHALDNPLLSPCECAGSMAFVHYLCVEQWRCRSRHPDAQNGLACETCGKPYALPPPASRPVQVPHHPMEQEDWLDAMPPHVMQALRQPHIWWRIGAAIVRRRWLRPIAPVIMSPIVALYCRARRLLKKRGVARRRWACSLCRRRARWKCVRCLRSYYCSRQCQNVSWHIVHKHVCYKPTRFWWSVVLYGAASLALFPGIFRDPLMYDLGLCLIPMSFVIMGILGGSMATFLKKTFGVDLRGRLLEFVVLLWTIWLTVISWGLVKGFFGNPSACYGAIGSLSISSDDLSSSRILAATRKVLLRPGKAYYLAWDRAARNSGKFVERIICTSSRSNVAAAAAETTGGGAGCFSHLPHANADFFTREFQGEACASDLRLVVWMYIVALFSYSGFAFWKWLEKRQNQRQRGAGRRAGRVHQD
jgi:RING-variant domain